MQQVIGDHAMQSILPHFRTIYEEPYHPEHDQQIDQRGYCRDETNRWTLERGVIRTNEIIGLSPLRFTVLFPILVRCSVFDAYRRFC